MFPPVRKTVFGEQVTAGLRDRIVRGLLPPGMRLVEETLAKQFGVSRGPIRDALRQLHAEGLIESRQPGAYVVGIGETDIDELYSLRDAIEALALTLAIERVPAAGWDRMRASVETLERAADERDAERFATSDIEFHSLIYTLSGHRRLADIWGQYAPILTALLRTTVLEELELDDSARNHRRLYELIVAGDVSAATAELKAHLEGSHRHMLDAHRKTLAAAKSDGVFEGR